MAEEQNKCPSCGAEIASGAPMGLCEACLLKIALGSAENRPKSTIRISPPPLAEKPGDRIGRYKLLQQIGEGGCGVVYMADQEEPVKRRVALKVIKPGMDTKEVLGRFEAERQALALMDHSNIAKVLDAGATETGRPFFVMELVKGVPITHYCDENKLDTEQRLQLFILVCQAVQHAHQKGIIHRDIKPSNVLVADYDGVPVPKIIDFGIAKATSGQTLTDNTVFTALEQFIGTPAYMSPEQAKLSGLDIDTRSDIYSLGVLLYELLTGKTPFDAKKLLEAGLDEIRRIIRDVEPPRPSQKLSTLAAEERTSAAKCRHTDSPRLIHLVRGDLDWIVMKCLEKDRNRRYETANGLAMELKRFINNEPVVARPPSSLYRFQKLVRRNKLAFAAASAVIVALVIGVVGSTWEAIRAKKAEKTATQEKLRAENAAEEAQRQRLAAENAKTEKSHALETMRIRAAEDYFSDNTPIALAYLARVLRDNRSNRVAAERLLSALTYRNFALPHAQPLRHQGKVNSVVFSPDGTQVVTASDDGTAQVWNASTGDRIGRPYRHTKAVVSAEFSPDGKQVVTASADGTAGIWKVGGDENSGVILQHSTNTITAARFSPNGRLVATASYYDGTILVWDAHTGRQLGGPFKHAGPVLTEAISPDGNFLLTGSDDCTARLWNLQTGQLAYEPMRHKLLVAVVGFSPDGKRLLTASWDHTACVWDAATGKRIFELDGTNGHKSVLFSAQYSRDGRWVLTSSKDTAVKVWDAATGAQTNSVSMRAPVLYSCFSSNSKMFVATSVAGGVRLWSTLSSQPASELITHPDAVVFAALSPEGNRLATACSDGTARMWDLKPDLSSCYISLRHDVAGEAAPVTDAVFDREGLRIATGAEDGNARVWDARTGKLQREFAGYAGKVSCVRFSPDGRWVAVACHESTNVDGYAQLWDLNNGQKLGDPIVYKGALTNTYGAVEDIEFSRDGRLLLTAGAGPWQQVRLFEVNEPGTLKGTFSAECSSVAFRPDGKQFCVASDGAYAYLLNIPTNQDILYLGHHEKSWSVRYAPDGSYLATASWDGMARIWNPQNGALLAPPLVHDGAVFMIQFSPDGQSVITASYDATARIWSATNGLALTPPLRHLKAVVSAEFSPDGLRAATASRDGTARLWDAKTGLAVSEPLRHCQRAVKTGQGRANENQPF